MLTGLAFLAIAVTVIIYGTVKWLQRHRPDEKAPRRD